MSFENETAKWWPKKKKMEKIHQVSEKLEQAWIKEFIGDPRLSINKPKAWESPPQMGMDKIRATTKLGKFFVDFASNSSVHGINHLTAPHRHPFEKFLAILFIGGALATSILLSWHFWRRYQDNATILVLNPRYRDFQVTIPSFMLCPLDKIDDNLFAQVFKKYNITNKKETQEFFAFIADTTYENLEKTPNFTEIRPEDWLKILWELKGDLSLEVVLDDFEPDIGPADWIMTEEGFCMIMSNYVSTYMSYNYWMANNWTIVNPPSTLPFRTYFERERKRGIITIPHSLKVSVYYPLEGPEIKNHISDVKGSQMATVYYDVQEIVTSDDVKSLSVAQRRCKTIKEGGLRMSPIYTHNMCVQECRYEIIRKLCHCYPHFARPMPGVSVCSAQQLRCVGKNRAEFEDISAAMELECGCLPNCDTSIYVNSRTDVTNLKPGSPNQTTVFITFNFPRKIILRELLFGFNDFLTAVGGAFGLFLGASVLSFAEIIDFFTFRLFWYTRKLSQEKKAELKRKQRVEAFFMKNAVNIQEKTLKTKY